MREPVWIWVVVVLGALGLASLDSWVLERGAEKGSARAALVISAIWILAAAAFGVGVWIVVGGGRAEEFYGAYLVEKGLAVDNVFVFAIIFSYFAIPATHQHVVMFDRWGLVAALGSRAAFISGGVLFLEHFHWANYVLGALVMAVALEMVRNRGFAVHPEHNPVLAIVGRFLPFTPRLHGEAFVVRREGRMVATPMLAALIAVETAEIVFSVDTIPAVLAVTDQAFLVFSATAFAVLGWRALYLLMAGAVRRFSYLRIGLALTVLFVGVKLLISNTVHISPATSLLAIAVLITATMLVSILRSGAEEHQETDLPVGHVDESAG